MEPIQQTNRKMKVVILEPSAIDYNRSHNTQSLIGHTAVLTENQFEVIWVTNTRCTISSPDITNYKEFTYTIYDDVRGHRTGLLRHAYYFYYRKLVKNCRNAVTKVFKMENIGDSDHVFIPTTDWILIQALLSIINNGHYENLPCIHLIVMYEYGKWMTGGYPYVKMLNRLNRSGLLDSKIFLYTETKRHANTLKRQLGINIDSYPFPSIPVEKYFGKLSESKIRVCALGGGRRDKGFNMLPKIFATINQKRRNNKNIEFVVQRPRIQDKLDESLSMLESIENVILKDNKLQQSEYEKTLVSCHIMLFPYDKNVYFARGSGLINETVANAIPAVCTENTSLEENIESGNGLSATTPEEFADAIEEIALNLEEYRKKAVTASHVYIENYKHNPVVERILSLSTQHSEIGQNTS